MDRGIALLERAIQNAHSICEVPPIFYRVLSNLYVMKFDWKGTTEILEKLLAVGKTKKSMSPWTDAWHSVK